MARFVARVSGPQADGGGTLIPAEVMAKALKEYQGTERRGLVHLPGADGYMGKQRLNRAIGLVAGVEVDGEEVRCDIELLDVPASRGLLAMAQAGPMKGFRAVPTIHAHIAGFDVVTVDLDRDPDGQSE